MITGASSGIGAAAATLFAAEGAAVVLVARRAERLDALVARITETGGRALAAPADVTSRPEVARAVRLAVDTYGGLDAAFNNAGWGVRGAPLHETDDALYDRIMDVNVRGVWNCLKEQIPVLLGRERGGTVVNTSSTAGAFATGAAAPYVAAKHAVLGLTRAAAAEYGRQGVRVNALMVGSTRTELLGEVPAGRPSGSRSVLKRLAEPLEVARAALWLCSDQSSFVTGAAVPVDGGCSAV
ncbi:SDR family oxidoreductase [Streptomyces sp. NPDC004539]|uniref:SDR family NAD(P)-dependent oxidoreductase n=1 Tax=Streptomyces sp. NPDC004539 TaxID=3154280 RepID=UPI0033AE6A51